MYDEWFVVDETVVCIGEFSDHAYISNIYESSNYVEKYGTIDIQKLAPPFFFSDPTGND